MPSPPPSGDGRQVHEPHPPFPAQQQPKPGLESKMDPRPRYRAPAYKAAGKLEGKAALITGGDSGIGRSVAVLYAKEGADVAIVFLPEERRDAEETRDAVEREGRRCVLIAGDLADPAFCAGAVDTAARELGRLDILVNNAAVHWERDRLEEAKDEEMERTFRVNVLAYIRMAREALRYIPEGGAIVNCGSIAGVEGNPSLLDYASTKGAIHAFTKSLAKNLAKRRIRVNCVSPGPVWTPLQVTTKEPESLTGLGSSWPMERPAQPEEIAPAFVFFASEADSSYVSGEILLIIGGGVGTG